MEEEYEDPGAFGTWDWDPSVGGDGMEDVMGGTFAGGATDFGSEDGIPDPLSASADYPTDSTREADEVTAVGPEDRVGSYTNPSDSLEMDEIDPMRDVERVKDSVTKDGGGPTVRGQNASWIEKIPSAIDAVLKATNSPRAGTNGVAGNKTGPIDLSGGGYNRAETLQSRQLPPQPTTANPAPTPAAGISPYLPTDPTTINQMMLILAVLGIVIVLVRK